MQLLESATSKLGFTTAARRAFLSDGTEAFRSDDIPKEETVFISRGEPFKSPFLCRGRSGSLYV